MDRQHVSADAAEEPDGLEIARSPAPTGLPVAAAAPLARGVELLDQDLPSSHIVAQAVGGEIEGVVYFTVSPRRAAPGPEAGATLSVAGLDDPCLRAPALTDRILGLAGRRAARYAE